MGRDRLRHPCPLSYTLPRMSGDILSEATPPESGAPVYPGNDSTRGRLGSPQWLQGLLCFSWPNAEEFFVPWPLSPYERYSDRLEPIPLPARHKPALRHSEGAPLYHHETCRKGI